MTKEKIQKKPPTAKGRYNVEYLLNGVWQDAKIVNAKNRRTLMQELGGYETVMDDGKRRKKVVNINRPQVRVRAHE